MNGLTMDQIPDLVMTTLPAFENRGRFEAAFTYQLYYFLDDVFQQDRIEHQEGRSIEWRIILDGNGTARHAGLYATRDREKRDVVRIGRANWTYADAEAYYEAHEMTANRGSAAIAKYIKTQYFAAYVDMADEVERRSVLSPDDPNDSDNPQGVSWWISMLDAGVVDFDGSFSGRTARYGDGTTTTVIGGIDAALEYKWRNWAANHNGMNLATMDTLRRGMIFTNFRPPRNVKEMYTGPASRNRILSSLTYQAEYERLVNMGPDDRNGDLNPFRGELTFRGVRWVGLATLEGAAYNPIYCINFAHFKPVIHPSWNMREDTPIRDVNQRHVFVQGIDLQYQYRCDNRRQGGFVLHEPIAA